jgi:uncharacterized protein (TIGR01244 family)
MLVLLVALLLAAAEPPAAVDQAAIPNYKLLRKGLAVGGKPSADALRQLKAEGFKTVVDLRTEGEGIAEEKAVVEEQGLRYVSVPLTAATLKLDDVLAVKRVIDDESAGPVLLHCASSNRVGAVIAVIAARSGKPLDQALDEGRAAGLTSPALVDAVKRVVGEAPPKP